MGRTKNAKACTMYKYKVINDNVTSYFTTQGELMNAYPHVNKSYIYRITNCPEKIVYRMKINIIKLDPPIAVHSMKIREIKFIVQEEEERRLV